MRTKRGRKSKGGDKSKSQLRHARRRAMERFGLEASPALIDGIIGTIQAGGAMFVEKQSHRISVFDVIIDCETYRVVYDKVRKTIVTFLPDSARL